MSDETQKPSTSNVTASIGEQSSIDDEHQQDICRVCRMESEPERPLFYPCVCTGSIKYVHQDCLLQWLKYSKKEYCELCSHKYTFQPIYDPDMPQRLPMSDFLHGLGRNILRALRAWFIYTSVAFAWLGVVPLTACRIYRAIFSVPQSILTLPTDLFSLENVTVDIVWGTVMIMAFLLTFICLVWLSEQIAHGGPQQALNLDNIEQHDDAIENLEVVAEPPAEQPPDQEANTVIHSDENGHNVEQPDGSREFDPTKPSTSQESDKAQVPVDQVETDMPADENQEDVVNDGEDNGGDEEDEGENGNDGIEGQDQNENNENNNHWFDWDRRNEDLSWERLLGLDGSLAFIEHVFWVICLNTVFTLVFAFSPYHVGANILRLFGLYFNVLHTAACTLLGYIMIECCIFSMNRIARLFRWSKLHRATGICYLVLKVGILFTLEAAIFPTLCGWWLDICSLTLFSASLSSRIAFFEEAPVVSLFLHWMLGTLYVFYFASFVLLLRDVLRPGTLWFFRNLNDPDFNPIQEMLTKPASWHAHRLVLSSLQFIANIFLVIFVPIRIIRLCLPVILPYNISSTSDTPLGELSLELLLLQVILPALLEQSHIKTVARALVRKWCQLVGNMLQLREYLLGKEEGRQPVPAAQNNDGNNNHNLAQEHFAIVAPQVQPEPQAYTRPEYFALRIVGLLVCLSITAILMSTIALSVPVTVGRKAIDYLSTRSSNAEHIVESVASSDVAANETMNSRSIHELYTVSCGLYVCYLAIYILIRTTRFLSPLEWPAMLRQTNGTIKAALKIIAALFGCLVIIPLLLGVAFQLIVLTPARVSSHQSPLYFPVQDWAIGVFLFKGIIALVIMGPENRWRATLEQINNDGVANLDLRFVYKEMVLPVAITITTFISVPYVCIYGLGPRLGLEATACVALHRNIYSLIVFLTSIGIFLVWQINLVHKLVVKIKDEKYLRGQKLVNYEPSKTTEDIVNEPEITPLAIEA